MKRGTHLTRYIRERRLELGLTQASVARALGYKPQFVTNWERGVSQPPADSLLNLCRVLKISEIRMLEILAFDAQEYFAGVLKLNRRTARFSVMGG